MITRRALVSKSQYTTHYGLAVLPIMPCGLWLWSLEPPAPEGQLEVFLPMPCQNSNSDPHLGSPPLPVVKCRHHAAMPSMSGGGGGSGDVPFLP